MIMEWSRYIMPIYLNSISCEGGDHSLPQPYFSWPSSLKSKPGQLKEVRCDAQGSNLAMGCFFTPRCQISVDWWQSRLEICRKIPMHLRCRPFLPLWTAVGDMPPASSGWPGESWRPAGSLRPRRSDGQTDPGARADGARQQPRPPDCQDLVAPPTRHSELSPLFLEARVICH